MKLTGCSCRLGCELAMVVGCWSVVEFFGAEFKGHGEYAEFFVRMDNDKVS